MRISFFFFFFSSRGGKREGGGGGDYLPLVSIVRWCLKYCSWFGAPIRDRLLVGAQERLPRLVMGGEAEPGEETASGGTSEHQQRLMETRS